MSKIAKRAAERQQDINRFKDRTEFNAAYSELQAKKFAKSEKPSNESTKKAIDENRSRLTLHEAASAKGLLPYIGERPILPDKLNPSVPDNIWECFQESGALAAAHLNLMLRDPRFARLRVNDQARIMELAFSRAYGASDGAVRKNMHIMVSPEEAKGFNALTDMSQKAKKGLPEFLEATISSDEDGDN